MLISHGGLEMEFDFDTYLDRHGMDALAVDPPESSPYRKGISLKHGIEKHIPMWIADMNFQTCPTITESIRARLEHPLFGYFEPSREYYDSIAYWHRTHNGMAEITEKNIGYENGVLGGVSSALSVLAGENRNVLVHSPTYIGFTHVLENNSYNVFHSPLVKDDSGVWRMDYADMEEKIRGNDIRVAIFCSPHNPSGRVWERGEIEQAMAVFERNNVSVISDEIWSDIILFDNRHIPTQSVSEYAKNSTIALYAPSKTFNLAGLIGSYHIIYNPELKAKMDKQASYSHYNSMNVLSMHALIGAYSETGTKWVKELNSTLSKNVDYAYDIFTTKINGVSVFKPQGTYMLYLDFSEWLKEHSLTISELLKMGYEIGVDWQNGEAFLNRNTIRMNLALPFGVLQEALDRLIKFIFC